jgi:hypothetical protein
MFPELEVKAINKALDFFATLAEGQTPPLPEAFGAEILAHALAKIAGVDVPEPMEDAGPLPGEKPKVGGMIRELPEAETMLRTHGWKRIAKPLPKLIFSALASNPGSQWSSKQLMERLPTPATTEQVQHCLYKLTQFGLLTRVSFGVYTLKTN